MATKPTKRTSTAQKAAARKTQAGKASASSSKNSVKPTAITTPRLPEPVVVASTTPVVAAADMKKKELIDLVVSRSGIKKKDAKPVVEAMLAVLGEAIADGRELNLQPLGKLRINRSVDKSNGRVFVCKLRQSKTASQTDEPIA